MSWLARAAVAALVASALWPSTSQSQYSDGMPGSARSGDTAIQSNSTGSESDTRGRRRNGQELPTNFLVSQAQRDPARTASPPTGPANPNQAELDARFAELRRVVAGRTPPAFPDMGCRRPAGPLTTAEITAHLLGVTLDIRGQRNPFTITGEMIRDHTNRDGQLRWGIIGENTHRILVCQEGPPRLLFYGSFAEIATIVRFAPRVSSTQQILVRELRQGHELRDSVTGCRLVYSGGNADSFRWSGDCNQEFIEGEGTIEWFRGNDLIWKTLITNGLGRSVRQGVQRYTVNPNDFNFELATCDLHSGFRQPLRRVIIELKPDKISSYNNTFFVESIPVFMLFSVALELARSQCPDGENSSRNIAVHIASFSGETGFLATIASARTSGDQTPQWIDYNNRLQAGAAQAVSGENQQRQVAAAQIVRQAEQQRVAIARALAERAWAVRWEAILSSDEPVTNVIDLVRHNRVATISRLARGGVLALRVRQIRFSDGLMVFTDAQTPTDIYAGLPQPEFSWDRWNQSLQQSGQNLFGFAVTCRVRPQEAGSLNEGQAYLFNASLLSLTSEGAVFDCSRPRLPRQ